MQPSFEHFDHTADMGIRIRAATRAGLLEPAAKGLYAAIGDIAATGDADTLTLALNGHDAAILLRDFLTELLHLFEHKGRVATSFRDTALCESSLAATMETQGVDEDRSVLHREVKAVTYHELAIRTIPGGFEATLIVDI